jgi:Rieske Fe-S protein
MATMDRRGFLAVCAVAPVLPLASACARMSYVPGTIAPDGRLLVGRAEFASQPFALVDAPGLEFPVYVHQHSADEFSAVLTRCMHRGCTVEPGEGKLVCPCHGSEYTSVGAVLKGPTQAPLTRFPVTADAQNVYIDVSGARR